MLGRLRGRDLAVVCGVAFRRFHAVPRLATALQTILFLAGCGFIYIVL